MPLGCILSGSNTPMRESDPYVESIELPGGWRGEVLSRCPYPTPGSDKPCALPDAGQWHSWLTSLTTDPSALCGYTVLKVSAGAEVFRARMVCSDRMIDVIGKQSRGLGSAWWLNGAWRPSRARRNFQKAHALLRAEIPTALPLAWIERRRPQRESWLVTRFVPDLVDLDQVALSLIVQLETNQVRAVKDGIIAALVELLLQFDRHGLHHRDLKASNILLQSWDGGFGAARTFVADLDGLRRARFRAAALHRKHLIRLAASLLGYTTFTRADGFRLLQAYVGRRPGRPGGTNRRNTTRNHCRSLFRTLASRSAQYSRRARRRKLHKLDGYTGD